MKPSPKSRRAKPTRGQLSILGDVYELGLKYEPFVARTSLGEAVVVLRLPPDVGEIDRKASYRAMFELARTIKSTRRDYSKRRTAGL